MLVREHGDDLTHDELVGVASLLLIAGHETTANMLAIGTLALLRHPEQAALVRDDPAAAAPAVEELMRFLSVVHTGVPRVATADTEVAGQAVAAGDVLVVSLPAADRDRALVEDPDRLDVGRAASHHVAFGHGVHHCLGAPLARMEMATAFPALLRRFPTLAPAIPFEDVEFRCGQRRLRPAESARSPGEITPSTPARRLTTSARGGPPMKIQADRDVCIGAGNCVLAAENVFDQDDDAIVVLLQETPGGRRRRRRPQRRRVVSVGGPLVEET